MLRNTENAYGWVAIAFHWAIALLITGQWILGKWMVRLDDQRLTFELIQWHKSTGFLILALVMLRLPWRVFNPPPELPASMPLVERSAARWSHRVLYVLMLLLPLSGWALVSVSVLEIPTLAFYLILIPHLPFAKSEAAEDFWATTHEILGWAMLAVVALHVLAALRHHFLLKDEVLRRMLYSGHR